MKPEPADVSALAACKDKLKHFRIKELKDVLHHLGLSRNWWKKSQPYCLTNKIKYCK